VKLGNGVHLLAPFSWRMTSFGLLQGESPVYLALTLAGVLVALWALARPERMTARLAARPGRLAAAAALAVAYLLAPLPFLDAIEASGSYSVKVLREREARTGLSFSLDRTAFTATPAGGYVSLWTGERVRAVGALPPADASVSLDGTFLAPDVVRVDRLLVHRGQRDWPSYAGLLLLAAVFARGAGSRARPAG
jgi:hypothetical protein